MYGVSFDFNYRFIWICWVPVWTLWAVDYAALQSHAWSIQHITLIQGYIPLSWYISASNFCKSQEIRDKSPWTHRVDPLKFSPLFKIETNEKTSSGTAKTNTPKATPTRKKGKSRAGKDERDQTDNDPVLAAHYAESILFLSATIRNLESIIAKKRKPANDPTISFYSEDASLQKYEEIVKGRVPRILHIHIVSIWIEKTKQ